VLVNNVAEQLVHGVVDGAAAVLRLVAGIGGKTELFQNLFQSALAFDLAFPCWCTERVVVMMKREC
jgi:hypothetical protein